MKNMSGTYWLIFLGLRLVSNMATEELVLSINLTWSLNFLQISGNSIVVTISNFHLDFSQPTELNCFIVIELYDHHCLYYLLKK